MARFAENVLEDILSRVDIVEIISGYIPLKRSGRNFKANCPFHNEKTASFMVSSDRQIYHCFGCAKGGNAFRFVMDYDRLQFPEAVQLLAQKAGVVLPSMPNLESKTESFATRIFSANEVAAAFYESNIRAPGALEARKYLAQRGISTEAAGICRLGFATESWDALIRYCRDKDIGLEVLEKAGLILAKSSGGYYDRFRSRIVFPILDVKNRVLGFGARIMPANETQDSPKYINSPETLIYTKGRHLYGLALAKDEIRRKDSAIIVEGYLDFLTPFSNGCKNIVATLGTALTHEQARLLKRYTHNIVMVYDGDAAGELAALRSLEIFVEEAMQVSVVSLPAGFDPDSFVRSNGVEKFLQVLESAVDLFDYKLKVLDGRYNRKEVGGKARISSQMLETICKFTHAVMKTEYIKKLGVALGVKEEALLEELHKLKGNASATEVSHKEVKKSPVNLTEKLLLKLMLEGTRYINRIKEECLEPADFQDKEVREVVSVLFDHAGKNLAVEPRSLVNHLDGEGALKLVCESTFSLDINDQNRDLILNDCIQRIKAKKSRLLRVSLHNRIQTAQESGDQQELDRLMREFHELVKSKP